MAQSRINWKRGDYIKLGRAVSNFNKKINSLQREENKMYLPEILNYKDIKADITTRQELNRMINSLRRFQQEDASELYETDAGEQITKWERRELGIQVGIAKRRLNKELKQLNEPTIGGFSRVQMGSIRAREIEAQIKHLDKIEMTKGYEFRRLKKSIKFQGSSDYQMKKAIIFRENYMNEMRKYSHFENYEKLMFRLKAINNPISFFDYVSQNEISGDLTYQSDQYFSEKEFDRFLESLGIDLENEESTGQIIQDLDENGYL
jgi:hypothetical protein